MTEGSYLPAWITDSRLPKNGTTSNWHWHPRGTRSLRIRTTLSARQIKAWDSHSSGDRREWSEISTDRNHPRLISIGNHKPEITRHCTTGSKLSQSTQLKIPHRKRHDISWFCTMDCKVSSQGITDRESPACSVSVGAVVGLAQQNLPQQGGARLGVDEALVDVTPQPSTAPPPRPPVLLIQPPLVHVEHPLVGPDVTRPVQPRPQLAQPGAPAPHQKTTTKMMTTRCWCRRQSQSQTPMTTLMTKKTSRCCCHHQNLHQTMMEMLLLLRWPRHHPLHAVVTAAAAATGYRSPPHAVVTDAAAATGYPSPPHAVVTAAAAAAGHQTPPHAVVTEAAAATGHQSLPHAVVTVVAVEAVPDHRSPPHAVVTAAVVAVGHQSPPHAVVTEAVVAVGHQSRPHAVVTAAVVAAGPGLRRSRLHGQTNFWDASGGSVTKEKKVSFAGSKHW